ncbi:hypothetical protein MA16_Dca020033 [Dendrobium catenatum]|uniref:Uncharacterized protein n=1 Tax=Dendrobium catenatum TaxID=906689 RepID=A0A2I0VYL1_9ASPA|nr:hypothetical protein MA16_Dca020033 [Dendrobium catenatum]
METPRILFSSDIFTVTPALVSALGFLQYLRFCISLFLPEVDDETVEDHQSGRVYTISFWSPADEGFIVLGHVLKFTSDEVALLIVGAVQSWANEAFDGSFYALPLARFFDILHRCSTSLS